MLRNLTPTVKQLIIINVLVFLLTSFSPYLENFLTLHYYESPNFNPIQLISYLFIHANFMHLFSNMFGLFMFGNLLERIWGPKRFLIYYFVCGIGAGILYMAIQHFVDFEPIRRATRLVLEDPTAGNIRDYWSEYGMFRVNLSEVNAELIKQNYTEYIGSFVLGGASGSIFGILMAFGYLFPNSEIFLFLIPIPIKAKWFVTFYGLYELWSGMEQAPGDNVAHFAHIGGMIFGILLLKIWNTRRNNFY